MPFSNYFNFTHISLNTVLFLLLRNIKICEMLNLEWKSDGICPQQLGYPVNNFLDQCFRGHHFFAAMRAYNLKHLYTINCCTGYREVSRSGGELRCSAVCKVPCTNGLCIKPETCQCKMGYFLRSPFECAPICSPSCINGDCVGLDICLCKSGYRKVNGSKHECEPICEKSCENGYCSFPGSCKCNEGYHINEDNSKCEPTCEGGCKNGVCSRPGICECLAGYEKIRYNACEPICHSGCGVGTCFRPDECSCPSGYHALKGQTCKPLCKGCSEGTCVSPDQCNCPSGRTINVETNECELICSPPCTNGICTVSGNCTCHEGYQINEETQHCEPTCLPSCKNGHCIGPNKCECYSGYKLKPFSDTICEPVCSSPCLNGSCIAPEICQCSQGFVEIYKNVCSPICLNGCYPGTCVSPNICECPEGYEAGEEGSCKPVCSPPCDKGVCIAPDVCICSDGYAWDDVSNGCVSSCKETCVNGICVSPNVCECLEGYEKLSDSHCYATCSQNCSNGICSAPDVCTCSPGFNKNPEVWYDCLPELSTLKDTVGPYLNVYTFPSSISFLEDNETFSFTDLPKFTIKKECRAASGIATLNEASNIVNLQINCTILRLVSEIELYCSWLPQIIDSMSLIGNFSSFENITIVDQNRIWDFRLYLLFPEDLAEVEDGSCTISLQPLIQPKYFSLNNLHNLVLKIYNDEEMDFSGEKGEAYKWTSTNFVIGILVLIGTTALILLLSIIWWYHRKNVNRNVEADLKLQSMEKENFTNNSNISHNFKSSDTSSNFKKPPITQASEL